MLQSSAGTSRAPIQNRRRIVQHPHNCAGDLFGRVCREIWSDKAAAQLASRSGASVRAAEYWLAGARKPSAAAAAAIINELFGHAH